MVIRNEEGLISPLDELVDDLQQLRARAGDPSYAEIALRIALRRQSQGIRPAAARIARSSVHAMFTRGRRRLNADLLAEIVFALTDDEAAAAQWRERYQDLRSPTVRASQQLAAPPPLPTRSGPNAHASIPVRAPRPFTPPVIVFLLVACVGLNHFGGNLNAKFQWPLFLDMGGTAIAAIALGPWYGALVGLTTNTIGALAANPVSIAFALVNIAGALVWGYGARQWRLRSPWWRFLILNIIVALTCTAVAVPINVLLFGGVAEGHAAVNFVALLLASGEGLWRAVFSVNIAVSLIDKIISGFFALLVVTYIDRWRFL